VEKLGGKEGVENVERTPFGRPFSVGKNGSPSEMVESFTKEERGGTWRNKHWERTKLWGVSARPGLKKKSDDHGGLKNEGKSE